MIRGWAAGLPEMILGSSGGTWRGSCPLRPRARRRRGRHTPATRLVGRRGCPRCPRARRPCICPLSTSPARPAFANRTIAPLRASCPAPAQLPSASPGASLSLFPARPPARCSVLSLALRAARQEREVAGAAYVGSPVSKHAQSSARHQTRSLPEDGDRGRHNRTRP